MDINASADGNTPLAMAAFHGDLDVCHGTLGGYIQTVQWLTNYFLLIFDFYIYIAWVYVFAAKAFRHLGEDNNNNNVDFKHEYTSCLQVLT